MVDVARWLEGLGLGQYAEAFAAAEIDGAVLADLSEADLEKLGLPLGPRKKLLRAITVLAPVYSWFTEGFGTSDLKEAKALLGEIG